jgi:hypothetical protein
VVVEDRASVLAEYRLPVVEQGDAVPEGPPTAAVPAACLGQFLLLSADAPGLVLGLLAGGGTDDTGHEAAVRGREVVVAARDGLDPAARAVDQVDEGFEFPVGPVQAVEVPDDDRADTLRLLT